MRIAISPNELQIIDVAAAEFSELWSSIRPPWPHTFDFTPKDVRAMDYLHYEGISFPKSDIDGAALICGEVLRRAARFEWATDESGNWFVAPPEHHFGPAFSPIV